MEWNGLNFDTVRARTDSQTILEEIKCIEQELNDIFDVVNLDINWSSRDHLSCLLYGGDITFEDRIQVGLYKTGQKAGQPRFKVMTWTRSFERLVEPVKGSEMAKEGYYATDVVTFRKLKTNKRTRHIIELLEKRSALMKLNGTYLTGLSDLIDEMGWDKLHGSFNQCVVVTGRLSSNRPNLQNIPKEAKSYITTNYVT